MLTDLLALKNSVGLASGLSALFGERHVFQSATT
jgi:hypothetical protein